MLIFNVHNNCETSSTTLSTAENSCKTSISMYLTAAPGNEDSGYDVRSFLV